MKMGEFWIALSSQLQSQWHKKSTVFLHSLFNVCFETANDIANKHQPIKTMSLRNRT